jgi:hypothetical protein
MKKIVFLLTIAFVSCNSNNSKRTEDETPIDTMLVDTNATEIPKIEVKKDDVKAKELAKFFRIKKDEFEETQWNTPSSAPTYRNEPGIYCYFSNSDVARNLRFVLQYCSDDWLFIRDAKFLVDGDVFDYFPKEVKRDNGDGGIWEWWDESVSINDVTMLKKISKSKSAKVKLKGDKYYDIITITNKQKLDIKRALEYYEALGGTYEY